MDHPYVIEQCGKVGRVRYISAHAGRVLTEATNGLGELRLATPGNNQRGTFAGKRFGNGEAEARGAAGD
jgi:hypothetical protein